MTKIFAHRGASGYAPENTLPAFAMAEKQGADGIELDVQLTKDGELVVIHDEKIDRTSTGKGFVRDYTLSELRKMSFCNHMELYSGVKIPTLEEVLDLVRPGNMTVNIELKTGIFWYPGIEEKTLQVVKDAKMEERVIYSSFNHYSIMRMKAIDPSVKCGFLEESWILGAGAYTKSYGVECWHPLYKTLTEETVKELKDNGIEINAWTVNEPDAVQSMIDLGIDSVINNYPDMVNQIIKK